ncbi:MAG: hypothetical protein ACXVKA_10400 [Acidimicrobiia bacterium]
MSYGPPPVAPDPASPAPQWGAPPVPGAMGYGPPRTDGMAIAALIVAIASFVFCPMISAIVALGLAHASGNKIDASGGRLTGGGLVRAAQIIAWVHIILVTIITIIVAIALVAADS